MRGRSKIFDEQEVIKKAIDVFWNKGYESASTEDLLKAMGIGKGSFYNAFGGGKEELFEKALDQFSTVAINQFKQKIVKSEDPVEELKQFFRSIAFEGKQNHLKGCFLGNTIAELSNINDSLKKKAVNLLRKLEQLFYEVLQTAKEQGKLKSKEDPKLLANYLITFWNGISITRRMYQNPKVLAPLIEMHLKMIQ